MTEPGELPMTWRDRLASLVFPVTAFALFRFIVHYMAHLGWTLDSTFRHAEWVDRSETLKLHPGFDALFRWDASYYVTMARTGYTEPRHANFFPAFPLEVRGLANLLSMDFHVASVVTASLNALVAVIAIYLLAEKLMGRDGARWTTIAFLAYPFAFFQVTAYPESLTVAAGATAVALEVYSRRKGSLLAIAISSLTRHTSVYGALAQTLYRWKNKDPWRTRLLPLVAWGVGLSIFCGFLYWRYGDPLMFITVRKIYWGDAFVPVWELSLKVNPMMIPGAMFALLPIAGTVMLWRTPALRFLAVPAAMWLALLLVTGGSGLGRHISSVWPAFLGLGFFFSTRPTIGALVLGLCAPFGGLMLFLHSHQWHVF
ncbi:MAG: hypothetical protein ABL982_19390 [Vicinamibacterales bacterium]